MKIFFIVDETMIMLPDWLDQMIDLLPDDYQTIGITPAGHKKNQSTIFTYLTKNIFRLDLVSLLKLSIYVTNQYIKLLTFGLGMSQKPGSITQVALKHKLKIINTNNVNDHGYLKKLKRLRPDIIFSSGSQIFKDELLALPKISCINRHSALLPSYGGLFPIFRGLINKERSFGVTIHKMVKEIDKGEIIFQIPFPIKKSDTLISLYQKSYDLSVFTSLEALRIIKDKRKPVVVNGTKPSYYSFPKDEDWKRFFKSKIKFI